MTDTVHDLNDPEIQKSYLSVMVSNPDVFSKCINITRREYFHDKLKKAVDFITNHYNDTSTIPHIPMIEAYAKVKLDLMEDCTIETWFYPLYEKFCRHRAMELVVMDSADLIEKFQYGEVEKRLKEALSITISSELGTDLTADPKSRLEAMKDRKNLVPTYLASLDKLLYGGLEKGGLNIFAAPSGMGKSLLLQNLVSNWAEHSLDCVYFSLELSENLVCSRLDAMVTGRSTSDVLRDIDGTVARVESWARKNKAGRVTVKKLPESGTCTNDLRAYLKEYFVRYGKYPDCIAVDYLDLMYPNNRKIDPSNMFIKDKFVSEELRALAGEFGIILVTASQLNRAATDAGGEFDHGHIAGGMSKINTADNVFGIYATQAMKERGEIRLSMMKIRSSSATGRNLDLAYDPICMRVTDAVITELTDHDIQQLRDQDAKFEEQYKFENTEGTVMDFSEHTITPKKPNQSALDLLAKLNSKHKR